MSRFNISGTSKNIKLISPFFSWGVRNYNIKIWLFVYIPLRSKIRLLLKGKKILIFFSPHGQFIRTFKFWGARRIKSTCIKKVEWSNVINEILYDDSGVIIFIMPTYLLPFPQWSKSPNKVQFYHSFKLWLNPSAHYITFPFLVHFEF